MSLERKFSASNIRIASVAQIATAPTTPIERDRLPTPSPPTPPHSRSTTMSATSSVIRGLLRGNRRKPLTSKEGNKNYYKGSGSGNMGRHTTQGRPAANNSGSQAWREEASGEREREREG
ncbi:uncharacterized protein BJ171DRAFT_162254 [Polychytrium aggregatum]|uniref:uncharacterized protein n=1 Tax=Polychytrium aggregatum TaxID=110093 RepID=UPI0022FEFA5D|nr:uncharacterized protein BJ171DRAFT_162254 [Polychytrium aggregatum]KAI9202836.1 hypothetical protein BJ171DRAFT_162254 [Polychytrium aggregatum]